MNLMNEGSKNRPEKEETTKRTYKTLEDALKIGTSEGGVANAIHDSSTGPNQICYKSSIKIIL